MSAIASGCYQQSFVWTNSITDNNNNNSNKNNNKSNNMQVAAKEGIKKDK